MNINKLISIVLLLLIFVLGLASCNFSGIVNTPEGGAGSGQTPETPEGGDGVVEEKTLTYEEYINLTADEQEEFFYTFASPAEFKLWHKEAKAKYDAEHKPPEIDGDIDIGDLLGPQE